MSDSNLDIFLRYTHGRGYWIPGLHDKWKRVTFAPAGIVRLGNVAGFLTGLAMAGKRDLAERLADSLVSRLDYLNTYGGDASFDLPDRAEPYNCPKYIVSLGDDRTFGGFTVAWYKPYSRARLLQDFNGDMYEARMAKGIPYPPEQGLSPFHAGLSYHTDEGRAAWKEVERVHEAEHSTDESAYSCSKCPDYFEVVGNTRSFEVEYGFAFNGGLILHGLGGENFTVSLSSDSGPHWSIHT